MPRICACDGYGKRLVKKDGSPDYHRHFCGFEYKNAKKRLRIQAKGQTREEWTLVPYEDTGFRSSHEIACAAARLHMSGRFTISMGGSLLLFLPGFGDCLQMSEISSNN